MIILNNLQNRIDLSPTFADRRMHGGGNMGLIKAAFFGFIILGQHVIAAKDLCQQSNLRGFCQGNLGIQRQEMPQIEESIREAYLFGKSLNGAVIECKQIQAHQLVPVQAEINHGIVISMVKSYKNGTFNPCERDVLVSHNGSHYKIMDGHHTSMACRLLGKRQQAIVIHESNNEVLSELQQFPGSYRRGIDDSKVV